MVLDRHSSSSPQAVPDHNKSAFNVRCTKQSPGESRSVNYRDQSSSSKKSSRRTSQNEKHGSSSHQTTVGSIDLEVFIWNYRTVLLFQNARRGSLETYGSPPSTNYEYFPHDLDDIYEYKTDHQYFTHTGAFQKEKQAQKIASDRDRSSVFRSHAAQSLDEYSSPGKPNDERYLQYRQKFDNSSFIKSLSNNSDDSIKEKPCRSSGSGSSSHHHHSIQEMIKHFGKKVHIWPRSKNHDSQHNLSLSNANENEQEDFRARSKSLDVNTSHKVHRDWGQTYKIYDKILKEGRFRHND